MRRALFISYYWPPSRSAGAQRVAKFCRYLPEFGYETTVLCAEERASTRPEEPPPGTRLQRVPYWFDPASWLTQGNGGSPSVPHAVPSRWASFRSALQRFAWRNCFIPDAKIGWSRPARKAIDALVGEGQYDVVISTAPPYTALLLGRYAHRRHGLPWVVDMRDPWLENHAYNDGIRLAPVRWANARLERSVLHEADRVVCVMNSQRALLAGKLAPDQEGKVTVITNGYDHADGTGAVEGTDRFTLAYLGTSYAEGYPFEFLDTLGSLLRENAALARDCLLRIVGNTAPAVRDHALARVPEANLAFEAHVPHAEFSRILHREQVLVLIVNEGPLHRLSLPSKLFEYLPTGNPILAVGPADHDAAQILQQTDAGTLFAPQDSTGIRRYIEDCHQAWGQKRLAHTGQRFPQYERRTLTEQLAGVLDEVVRG